MALVKRHFLGWDKPALEAAVEWLCSPSLREEAGGSASNRPSSISSEGQPLDLSDLILITPVARVGRLLLGMLVDKAESLGVPLFPPFFSTPGELPEFVLGTLGTPVGRVQRRLAWSRALQHALPQQLEALIPHRPDPDDQRSWQAISSMLESAHEALIGEGLRFSDVPGRAPGLLGDLETARWRAAAVIQNLYAEELRQVGLIDTGLARLGALNNPEHPLLTSRIVLIGVQEPSEIARRALARSPVPVETVIFAPESLAHTFDEFGGIVIDEWHDRRVDIPDFLAVLVADGPDDQARRAMEAIAGLDLKFAPHQTSIVAPDATLVPPLQRAAQRYGGIHAQPAAGTPLSRTSLYQLLRAIEAFLDGESFASLGVLVRQPDCERYLLRAIGVGPRETWLREIDRYGRDHIPGPGLNDELFGEEDSGTLKKVRDAIRRVLAPLREHPAAPGAIFRVLERIYRGNRVGRDDPGEKPELLAADTIRNAVGELAPLPPEWLPTTGVSLLRLVLDVVSGDSIAHDGCGKVLEILGWLELPMDPAPVAIITGFNDGLIPESFDSDALLPDTLRETLGIASSRRRMARDAYLLSLIAHSRKHLTVISGRRASNDEPLRPSRLLFAADPDTVVRRVRRFVDQEADAPRIVVPRPRLVTGTRDLFPMLPRGRQPKTDSMRVTAFRTFLASPYRFYLEQILDLKEHVEQPPEIDKMAFGTLIHAALEAFGRSDVRDSTNEGSIRDCLRDNLHTLSRECFGPRPAAAVAIQLEVASLRLAEFARFQKAHREQGWRIDVIEWKPEGGRAWLADLPFDFYVRGKIDRVDRHDDGRVAILDYKTGDREMTPAQSHGRREAWKDLQLPLYRHLAAGLGLPESADRLSLAYITLPSRPGGVELRAADWSEDDLEDADRTARAVATRVHEGDWFHVGDDPPDEGTIAALCGTAFMSAAGSSDAGPGGEGGDE